MPFKSLTSLAPQARQLAAVSTAWMDPFWDETMGLLWYPGFETFAPLSGPASRPAHMVRDTTWYVVGLFLRRQGSDIFRALHAMHAVLGMQFNTPGLPYHGTFARSPEEALPQPGAREWRDYDPNWREFVITPLQVLLREYEPLIPQGLVEKIDHATRLAVEGALERGLRAGYTNIALMNAFMLCQAGERLHEPQWLERGEQMAQAIYDLFKVNDAFEEYNSPTYYGVDLYALALWRAYGPTPLLRQLGAEMEGLLWTDISRYYHAGLRNLCGPFDRAYGMDMTRYAAVVAEWIWLVTGQEQAPFPDPQLTFAHTSDFCYSPCAAMLGAVVPEEAQRHFLTFQGPRQVEHVISVEPRRVATAWLDENFMWGGEATSRAKQGYSQFHSLTLHWQAGPGAWSAHEVGWMRLLHIAAVDVAVNKRSVTVQGSGPLSFLFSAPGLSNGLFQAQVWQLPGLTIQISATPAVFEVTTQPHGVEVSYNPGPDQMLELSLTVVA